MRNLLGYFTCEDFAASCCCSRAQNTWALRLQEFWIPKLSLYTVLCGFLVDFPGLKQQQAAIVLLLHFEQQLMFELKNWAQQQWSICSVFCVKEAVGYSLVLIQDFAESCSMEESGGNSILWVFAQINVVRSVWKWRFFPARKVLVLWLPLGLWNSHPADLWYRKMQLIFFFFSQ